MVQCPRKAAPRLWSQLMVASKINFGLQPQFDTKQFVQERRPKPWAIKPRYSGVTAP